MTRRERRVLLPLAFAAVLFAALSFGKAIYGVWIAVVN